MVLRLAADFPDALVGVLPPPCCGIGQADQEPTLGGSELPDLFGQPVDRRKKFSVDVQLDLIPGTVADPHGPALDRQPSRCSRVRSVRSRWPSMSNMICRSPDSWVELATVVR